MSSIRYRYRAGLGLGGYSGKARKNRDRSRAARFDVQHMLDEFSDLNDGDEKHDRFIPIGRRSEFLPTVMESSERSDETRQQVDLPLTSPRDAAESHKEIAGSAPDVIRMNRRDTSGGQEGTCGSTCGPKPTAVISTRPAPRLVPHSPEPRTRPKSSITVNPLGDLLKRTGGLMYGCAIGSAAAAMILLVLRVAIL